MKNLVIVLFVLALAVTVFAQEATVSKTDNKEVYNVAYPVPVAESVPCDFISTTAVSCGGTVAASIGTVPATARRAMVVANTPVTYGFSSAVNWNYPPIASGGVKVFTGAYGDIDDLYFLAPATGTVQVLYFIK